MSAIRRTELAPIQRSFETGNNLLRGLRRSIHEINFDLTTSSWTRSETCQALSKKKVTATGGGVTLSVFKVEPPLKLSGQDR